MDVNNILDKLLNNNKSGIISRKELLANNISRYTLNKLINANVLTKYGRGLYLINNLFEDDMYILQQKYKKGIYSHVTALYLLGYTLRTPITFELTFPKGYNTVSLKNENVKIIRVINDNYELGIITVLSPNGNKVCCYNIERTICDILRGKGSDIDIINYAIKKYIASKDRNIQLLLTYAEQLNVKSKVLRYLEVLL